MLRLSEQEKPEIVRFIEADKPLPNKYRFLLFDDKREVELVWNGKSGEVCNIVRPFQTIEQADVPRWDVLGGTDCVGNPRGFEGMDDVQLQLDTYEEQWIGDYVFENEWQFFRTKKDRSLELASVAHEYPQPAQDRGEGGGYFGNDTMTIVEVSV